MADIAKQAQVQPWCAYIGWDDGVPLGFGIFKSSPDAHGEVEIGYLTFSSSEGKGIATTIAGALVGLAWDCGATRVLAQTLPQPNASTRVLEKNGFRRDGIGRDPEVGEVWRWRLDCPHGRGEAKEAC
jgi:RimJ/RimL family protein N-acetyltransferase